MNAYAKLKERIEETNDKKDLNKLLDIIEREYKNNRITVKEYSELTRMVCDKVYYEVEV